jgi:hypothetical protein
MKESQLLLGLGLALTIQRAIVRGEKIIEIIHVFSFYETAGHGITPLYLSIARHRGCELLEVAQRV